MPVHRPLVSGRINPGSSDRDRQRQEERQNTPQHCGCHELSISRFSSSSKTPSAHFIAMPADEAEPDLEV